MVLNIIEVDNRKFIPIREIPMSYFNNEIKSKALDGILHIIHKPTNNIIFVEEIQDAKFNIIEESLLPIVDEVIHEFSIEEIPVADSNAHRTINISFNTGFEQQ